MNKSKLLSTSLVFMFLATTSFFYINQQSYVFAQPETEGCEGAQCIINRVEELSAFAIGVIGLVILVNFVSGAIMYITAAGSPERIAHAKTRMMRGVAGIVMLALLGAVARWALLGVDPG